MILPFIEAASGFEIQDKIKLALFFAGKKPVTYVALKIHNKNMHEKHRFEELLREHDIIYETSTAKGYEEIQRIKGNRVIWDVEGIWFGYDLFHTKKQREHFHHYTKLMKKAKFKQADKLAGKLYGYPDCCVTQFSKERETTYLKKHYTYYEYYQSLTKADKLYPFLFLATCSLKCKRARALNTSYRNTLKKTSKRLYELYTHQRTVRTKAIVEGFSDVKEKGRSIWKVKDGFDYNLITLKPVRRFGQRHYLMIDHLSKAYYPKGQVLHIDLTLQYDYADVHVRKLGAVREQLHHERKFPLIARKY